MNHKIIDAERHARLNLKERSLEKTQHKRESVIMQTKSWILRLKLQRSEWKWESQSSSFPRAFTNTCLQSQSCDHAIGFNIKEEEEILFLSLHLLLYLEDFLPFLTKLESFFLLFCLSLERSAQHEANLIFWSLLLSCLRDACLEGCHKYFFNFVVLKFWELLQLLMKSEIGIYYISKFYCHS